MSEARAVGKTGGLLVVIGHVTGFEVDIAD